MQRLKKYPGFLIGICLYGLLFFVALIWNAGFSVMGVQNAEITKLVLSSFWPYVLLAQIKIFAAYLIIGAVIGFSADVVVCGFRSRFLMAGPAWIAGVTGYFLLAGIRAYPQLYTEALYDRGGLLRRIQVVITHTLPSWFIPAFGIILLLIICAALVSYFSRAPFRRRAVVLVFFGLILAIVAGRSFKTARIMSAHTRGTDGSTATVNALPVPNILILAADSLRNDAIADTRQVQEMSRDGVVFQQQYTSLPRTFPAIISLLTGKLPVTHGVRHMFPSKNDRDHRADSLPYELRRRGYATAAVSDFAGDVFSRFSAGFDTVKAPYFNFVTLINQRSLEIHFFLLPFVANSFGRILFPELKESAANGDPFLLADEAMHEIAVAGKKPFFTMVFFSTLHFPYAAPDPYYRAHTSASYSGRFKYHKPPILDNSEHMTDDDIRQIRGLYRGALDAYDDAVGKIIAFLKKKNLYDNTLIIITADHGENLYENNWHIGHGEHLRGNHVVNVPLIIKFPKSSPVGCPAIVPHTITSVTRDIDIEPTLLDYLGISPPQGIDGTSLMPLAFGEQSDMGLTAFSETGIWFSDLTDAFYQKERIMYPDITGLSRIDFTYNLEVVIKDEYRDLINTAKHRMVDDGRYRLIYAPTRQGMIYELFDRQTDPSFERNLVGEMPEKVRELKKKLFAYMTKDPTIIMKNEYAVPQQ